MSLPFKSLPVTQDPIAFFRGWLADAKEKDGYNHDAAALATADEAGRPSVRMVLVRGIDERGFVFYSNEESRKGRELAANAEAALCFYWKPLKRQARIEGAVVPVADAEVDAYFASRPRGAQIGAWASAQSRPLEGRLALERRVAEFTAKFGLGAVPRPPHWRGYRVVPRAIEFWEERPFRLHDRVVYHQEDGNWLGTRLYP